MGARGGIWVPPEAKLELLEGKPYILYPVPEDWPSTVPIQQLNFEELANFGWVYKESTKKLLDDFIALSNATPNKVLKFVKKWGPLWVCVSHSTHNPDSMGMMGVEIVSFVHPVGPLHGDLRHGLTWCSWTPAEAVTSFVYEARRAKAALSIYTCIKLGKEENITDWAALGFLDKLKITDNASAEEKNFIKKLLLCRFIESKLSEIGFSIDPSDLKIKLVSDLGFIRAVWMQVAQAMTQMRGIYVCDNCGEVYTRSLRKPVVGKLNFCSDCGKRGSKRAYYRRTKSRAQGGQF